MKRRGHDVLVLERQKFPRFSIGESLLVHCLDFVEEAGMLAAVEAAGFQNKNGAAFARNGEYADYDFGDRFTPGLGRPTTFQVERATFDKILADEAEKQGVEIRYEVEITAVSEPDAAGRRTLTARDLKSGEVRTIEADFVLDASGFGRTLPKLLKLEEPSKFPTAPGDLHARRGSHPGGAFDRKKIRVTVHPKYDDVWFWLIPFSGGRTSLGVVAAKEYLDRYAGPPDQKLRALVAEDHGSRVAARPGGMGHARARAPRLRGQREGMAGPGFALLGNAAEFLDPVFSSGVTIAMRSASMAAGVLHRQFSGENRRLEAGLRRAAAQGRGLLPRLRRGLVRRALPEGRVPSGADAGHSPDDFVGAGGLRAGMSAIRSSRSPQRRLDSVVAWVGG